MKTIVSIPALLLLASCQTFVADRPRASMDVASLAADPAWQKELASYNVVWTTPSENSNGSMPLAGGILGLNVWVEKGAVCFLMGSPNCLDENGMQTKLGLVRLTFSPTVFDHEFRQELRLAQSEIVVSGKTASGAPVSVTLWCGVDKPVIHAETVAGEPVEIKATYETWSNYEARAVPDGVQWVRRLAEVNARRQHDLKVQGMAEFADKVPDPLSGLAEGGRLVAPGCVDAGAGTATFNGMKTRTCSMKTPAPVKQLDLTIAVRMEQDKSRAAWEAALDEDARRAVQDAAADHTAALAYWDDFWGRSHICIHPGKSADVKSEVSNQKSPARQAWEAGRNYQLFRYLLAANRQGRAMTLFNGGNFTCTGNPDTRMWDNCQYMAQNQMLVYWPMQRSGDFDLLKVGCDFYRDRMEMNRLHAKKFWDVDGVVWFEPLSIFGMDSVSDTDKDGRDSHPCGHLKYHYTSGMVFALMMLGYDSYAGTRTPGYADAAFGIISYYDQYYQKKLQKETGKPLDAQGKLVIYPSDGCEPYHGCVNNIDVLAGLMALTRDLLATPPGVLGSQKRAYLEGFSTRIPEFKIEEKNGRKLYAAADKPPEWIFRNSNMDFPQMYICFPFSAVSLGRSDMTLVKNTWELGPVNAAVQHQNQCWYQNSINFARMGMTPRAKGATLQKLVQHPHLRFPAFWTNNGFDHAPDTDHGANALTSLQEMIMQTDGRRILLGAAWPAEWDCTFKLHAPYQTTVEGHVAAGKVIVDKVTPKSRRADIEMFPLQQTGGGQSGNALETSRRSSTNPL